jgi:hypothetical protein
MRFFNDHDPLPLSLPDQIARHIFARVGVEYRQHDSGVIVIDFSVR